MKHVPQEERKAETKKKLVESAMALFSEKGYYETNSKEIAENAGLAVGSFYRHFTDKKDILKHVFTTYAENAFSASDFEDHRNDQDNPELARQEAIRTLVNSAFEQHRFTPAFYRQVTTLSETDSEIGQVFSEYKECMLTRIQSFLTTYAPNKPTEELNAACEIVYAAIEGTIHAVQFSRLGADKSLYLEQLVKFINGYFMEPNIERNHELSQP